MVLREIREGKNGDEKVGMIITELGFSKMALSDMQDRSG